MAFALDQIGQGNIPNDRLALRELARELNSWPIVRKGLKKAAGELDPEPAEQRKASQRQVHRPFGDDPGAAGSAERQASAA